MITIISDDFTQLLKGCCWVNYRFDERVILDMMQALKLFHASLSFLLGNLPEQVTSQVPFFFKNLLQCVYVYICSTHFRNLELKVIFFIVFLREVIENRELLWGLVWLLPLG